MSNQITPNPSVPSQVVAQLKFPRFVNNLGIIPTSYKDSMSYYETLAWLCKFLEETVIPTVNENGEAVEELQNLYVELNSYVTNYFDNLDVQEEINNKLDDMVEAGTLQEIISAYLDSQAIFGFVNVEEMTEAQNLVNGSYARTCGYYEKNDGGGCLYKITNDVTNELFYETMTSDNLYAVPIFENYHVYDVDKLGMKKSNTTTTETEKALFNTNLLKDIIQKLENVPDSIIRFSNSLYQFNNGIKITKSLRLQGTLDNTDVDIVSSEYAGTTILDISTGQSPFLEYEPADYDNDNTSRLWGIIIENIKFSGTYQEHDGLIIKNAGHVTRISNVTIMRFSGYGLSLDCNNDSFIDNLNIIECGIEKTNVLKYALNLSSSLASSTTTNAIHFFGLHIEHCRYCINIDYATQIFFNSTKIEPANYSGTTYVSSSEEPAIRITGHAYQINFNNATFNCNPYNSTNQKYYFMIIDQIDNFSIRTRTLTNCNFTTGSTIGAKFINVKNSNTQLIGCSFTNINPVSDSVFLQGGTSKILNSSLNLVNVNTSSLTTVYVVKLSGALIDDCSITSTNVSSAPVTAINASGECVIGNITGYNGIKYFINLATNVNIKEQFAYSVTSTNITELGTFDENDFFTLDFNKFQRPYKDLVISSLPRKLKIKELIHFPNGYNLNITNNQATYEISLTQYGSLKLPTGQSIVTLSGAGTYFKFVKSMVYGMITYINDLA